MSCHTANSRQSHQTLLSGSAALPAGWRDVWLSSPGARFATLLSKRSHGEQGQQRSRFGTHEAWGLLLVAPEGSRCRAGQGAVFEAGGSSWVRVRDAAPGSLPESVPAPRTPRLSLVLAALPHSVQQAALRHNLAGGCSQWLERGRAADNTRKWTMHKRIFLNKRYCPRGPNFGVDSWTIGQSWINLIPGLIILVLHAVKRPSLAAQSARPILACAAVGNSHKYG